MTGWVKRRSTRTTTVLSCLSLTTTPWSMRFGISDYSGLAFERVARFGLAAGSFLRGAVVTAGGGRAARLFAAIPLFRREVQADLRTRADVSRRPPSPWQRGARPSLFCLCSAYR